MPVPEKAPVDRFRQGIRRARNSDEIERIPVSAMCRRIIGLVAIGGVSFLASLTAEAALVSQGADAFLDARADWASQGAESMAFILSPAEQERLADPIQLLRDRRPQEALAAITARAEAGDPAAQLVLGHFFEVGVGVEPSVAKAEQWFRAGAEGSHPGAIARLGLLQMRTPRLEEPNRNADGLSRLLDVSDSLQGAYFLGLAYAGGLGVARDFGKASQWFERGAKMGDYRAAYRLALLLTSDTLAESAAVSSGDNRAIEFLDQAVAADYVPALLLKARWLNRGTPLPQDTGAAMDHLEKAAQLGSAEADFLMGQLLEIQEKDVEGALSRYRKAAGRGLPVAQNELGVCYDQGRLVRENPANAVTWFQKASDGGYPVGTFNLALLHARGRGVEEDQEEASRLFLSAARRGLNLAAEEVGFRYLQGVGVERDEIAAIGWLDRAAKGGRARAQLALGDLYEQGRGIDQSDRAARRLYGLAADQGLPLAQLKLSRLYAEGRGGDRDFALAHALATLASREIEDAKKLLPVIEARLSAEDRERSTRIVEEWSARADAGDLLRPGG